MKNQEIDFRIGNLVEYDGRIFEIDSIAKEFPTLNTEEFGIGVVDWDNIKPIKLTEDWILKFAFAKKEKSMYGTKYTLGVADWGLTIENSFEEGKWFFGHEYYDSGDDSLNYKSNDFCFDLKYVHQFQNICYAIIGSELQTQAGGV